jgi:hypothetical protein
MRRFAVSMSILAFALLVPAVASADDYVGAAITHGTDPVAIGQGPEAAPATPIGGSVTKRVSKLVPETWCGTEQSTDDTTHEVNNGDYRFHGVYMIAADGKDRFSTFSGTLQTDAFQASSLLETDYNRAIRFDLGTSCGPQYLDITVIRLPQTTAEMADLAKKPNGTFDAVTHALDAAGFETIQPTDTMQEAAARTRNYLVWLDAPAPAASCGQAAIYDDPSRDQSNLNNFGGKTAIVFRNGDNAFCSSNADRHEMGHNLGALQPEAPHAFDGSHCNDAYEDTMCYSNSPQVADGQRGTFFDYKNDDYWSLPGAPLPWWTVDLNRFLCPDATCNQVGGNTANPDPGTATAPVTAAASPNSSPAGTVRPNKSHGRVKLHAKRRRRGVWKLRLRATGAGTAVVIVRCRRKNEGQVRTVLHRAVKLPRSLHSRVRCGASRPRAKLLISG